MAQCNSWDTLREAVGGELVLLNSQASWDSFKLFNSASRPDATPSAGSSSAASSSISTTPTQVDLSLSSPAVLYPRTSQDVLLAVNFAHAHGLEVSVKSGGYNPSNWSTSGRLIIDLKELKSVVVRPRNKGAYKLNRAVGTHDGMTPTVHERSASTLSISGVGEGNSTVTNSTYISGQATASGSATSNKRKQPSASSSGPTFAQPTQPASGALGEKNIDLVSAESSKSGSDDQSKPTDSMQDVQMNGQDASAHASQRTAGKRRMLDSDRSAQSSSGSNGNVKVITARGSNSDGPQYIQANAYPPFNLVNANAQQRKEFYERAGANENGHAQAEGSSSSERATNGNSESQQPSVPFIHDPIRKSTVFPGKAPPGTVPFSTSNTPNRNNGTGNDTTTERLFAATTTSEAAQSSAPWPRAPRPEGHRSASNDSNASSSSSTLSNTHFGAAPPEDYALVSFGSGTTAHHLDRVTATSAYHSPISASLSDSDGKLKGDTSHASDYASNEFGIECFVPWACYPVGSAIFLTGGYGFVSRLYGLSMDLVTELELVLPPGTPPAPHGSDRDGFAGQVHGVITKGRIVHLKSDYATDPSLSDEQRREQEELWWVCRGAGTAFGIVTNITAKAYNIGQVLAGNVIFPFNPLTTPSLLKHWRDCLKIAPRELYTNVTLTAGPSEKGHVVVIQFSWCGKKVSEGESILQTILSWDGERCLLKDVEVRPYKHQQENVSQILSSKDNTRWLVRSTLLRSLSDKSIHNTVELFRASPPGCSWLFETAGEAIAEPAYPSCFPMDHRKAPFQVAALHQWTNSSDDDKQKQLAESWVYHCLKDEACGPFPCFLSSGEGRERISEVYGRENWQRIKQLKEKYDPYHVMKYNHLEEAL